MATKARDMADGSAGEVDCRMCHQGKASPFFETKGYVLARCLGCGGVFIANPPSAEELKRIYSFDAGYHDGLGHMEESDAGAKAVAERRADELERHRPTPGRVLEIGCATGRFLSAARARGWETVGVELSEDTAEIARSKHGLTVHSGELGAVDLDPESFDVVAMWDVLEHVPDPQATLDEVRRLLKPGGLVLIVTPNIDGLFPKLSLPVGKLIGVWPHPNPPHHLFQFSKRSLTRLAERTGFHIRQIRDSRIALDYTFGSPGSLLRHPKRLAYALAFAPVAWIAPFLSAGDEMTVVLEKADIRPV